MTDSKTKANISNNFLIKQCTSLGNGSILPENQVYLTNSRMNLVLFFDNLITKVIRNVNVNKVYGHEDISITMIKMCDESLVRPLSIAFRNSLNFCIYPSTWKKANVIPIHKKDDKQCVNNYRPVSLLPVFGKIFEKQIFNETYSFLDREKLLNTNQPGFRPSDSFVNQLLIIIHEIFFSFDYNSSQDYNLTIILRSIFLDISKAFVKVWYESFHYKPKSLGISGNLLNLSKHYLSNMFQRFLLNGQCSNWQPVHVRIPQGTIFDIY